MNYNTGTIKLCRRSGEVVAEKKYDSVFDRRYEIQVWKSKYGPAYFHCHFIICPNVDTEAVDIMGGNIRKGWHRKKSLIPMPKKTIEPPVPFIRPPAIYDNKNYLV